MARIQVRAVVDNYAYQVLPVLFEPAGPPRSAMAALTARS
jgi:hypothetical protein